MLFVRALRVALAHDYTSYMQMLMQHRSSVPSPHTRDRIGGDSRIGIYCTSAHTTQTHDTRRDANGDGRPPSQPH